VYSVARYCIKFQGGIVRKYLGVLAGVLALCVVSSAQTPAAPPAPTEAPAQTPAQTPPATPAPEATQVPTPNSTSAPLTTPLKYPRLELFAGGSYAEAGFFNAGHWAGLPGWDASFGLNATSWLGIVFDGGQYFGTSKIPSAVPAPFPPCGAPPSGGFCPTTFPTFNVDTREYNILFGAQFSKRKYESWTPFAEVLYGHAGIRGQATAQGAQFSEVSGGRALVVGGGLDHKITERFALRLKADYLQTGTSFALLGKEKQDNFRFAVGIVIRSVHKKKPRLEDEGQVEP